MLLRSGLIEPRPVLVGGVAQLWQGDWDFGRAIVARLAADRRARRRGNRVVVEDLHYGAVAVAQRIAELDPAALVLVGAASRGRAPGALQRRRIAPEVTAPLEVQRAVGDAVTGYVSIDLIVSVAVGLGFLDPSRCEVATVELEPHLTGYGEHLSAVAAAAVEPAVELTLAEVDRLLRASRSTAAPSPVAPSPAAP